MLPKGVTLTLPKRSAIAKYDRERKAKTRNMLDKA